MPPFDTALVWFSRDLRNFDQAALYHALKQSRRVFCAFIFDRIDKAVLKHKPTREAVLSTFANMPVAMIGIEACAGSKRKMC